MRGGAGRGGAQGGRGGRAAGQGHDQTVSRNRDVVRRKEKP